MLVYLSSFPENLRNSKKFDLISTGTKFVVFVTENDSMGIAIECLAIDLWYLSRRVCVCVCVRACICGMHACMQPPPLLHNLHSLVVAR